MHSDVSSGGLGAGSGETVVNGSILTIDANGRVGEIVLPKPDLSRCPFKVGDRVRLNDKGFQAFRPSGREEIMAAAGVLVISDLGQEVSPGSGTWEADVEGPLSKYLFWTELFDKVEGK